MICLPAPDVYQLSVRASGAAFWELRENKLKKKEGADLIA
jgi:hypothetical protein